MTDPNPPQKSGLATGLAVAAISVGALTFVYGGLEGRRAGWELMAIPTVATVVLALAALAVQRRALTFASGIGVGLAVLGFLAGA